MTDRYSSNKKLWRQMLDDHWDEQLDDEMEFDVDLLAAVAEGSASDEEEKQAQDLMAANPAALECFLAMRDHVSDELRNEEEIRQDHGQSAQVISMTNAIPGEFSKRLRTAQWAAAACFLLAVSVIGYSITLSRQTNDLNNRLAQLSTEIESTAQQLADQEQLQRSRSMLSQKEQALTLAANRRPIFAAGKLSPGILKTATLKLSGTRGTTDPETPAEKTIRESVYSRWKTVMEEWEADEIIRRIEEATLALANHDLDEAYQILEELKSQAPDAPEVRNFDAVLMLAEAETAPLAEAEELTASAEQIWKELTETEPEYSTAWLNLALLVQRRDGIDAARELFEKYMELESDEELKAIIRDLLGNAEDSQ